MRQVRAFEIPQIVIAGSSNHIIILLFSQDQKQSGSLELQRRRAKLRSGNAPIEHPNTSSETIICFGDFVCLEHTSTGTRLACDIWDEILPGQGVFSVSGVSPGGRSSSSGVTPVARSVFVIVPPFADEFTSFSKEDPAPVTYGSAFRLKCMLRADEDAVANGIISQKPFFYLGSSHKSERMASRLTNRQMVFAVAEPSSETLWTIERAVFSQGIESAEDKYFSKNQPVEVDFSHRFACSYMVLQLSLVL